MSRSTDWQWQQLLAEHRRRDLEVDYAIEQMGCYVDVDDIDRLWLAAEAIMASRLEPDISFEVICAYCANLGLQRIDLNTAVAAARRPLP